MHSTKRLAIVGTMSALALALSPAAALAHDGGDNIIKAPLTPSMPAPASPVINGVNPGGLPWIIEKGSRVRVRDNGRMDVRIRGLQVPNFNGGGDANPVGSIDAVLYCGGMPVADSGPQPMSMPGGDARFRVWLDVPRHCDMATVLISPSAAVGAVYIASAMAGDHDDDD
jgi:hypothetical protein